MLLGKISTKHDIYFNVGYRNLSLRKDKITQGNCQKDILKNAHVTEDNYFVAPLGNIPLHEVAITEEESFNLNNEN